MEWSKIGVGRGPREAFNYKYCEFERDIEMYLNKSKAVVSTSH